MFIVLVTSGKNESCSNVMVKLFKSKDNAEKYCTETTDNPMDKKYWKFAEIIEEDKYVEPARYKNY